MLCKLRSALKFEDDGFRHLPGAVVDIPEHIFAALPEGTAVPFVEPTEIRDDGPTLEEYLAAGYTEAGYPPPGYTVRDSPGMDALRATRKADALKSAQARVAVVAPVLPVDVPADVPEEVEAQPADAVDPADAEDAIAEQTG